MSVDKNSGSHFASVRPNVESLISETTKKSFLSTADSDSYDFSASPLNRIAKSDIEAKSSYVPLLPRRLLHDTSNRPFQDEADLRLKWRAIGDHMPDSVVLHSIDSSSTLPPSSLLSKVDVEDDSELDDITTLSSWDNDQIIGSNANSHFYPKSKQYLSSNKNPVHLENQSSDVENYIGLHDPASGDMPSFVSQSSKIPIYENTFTGFHDRNNGEHDVASSSSQSSAAASVQTSYIVSEPTFSSLDSARAAGYPVIAKVEDHTKPKDQLLASSSDKEDASSIIQLSEFATPIICNPSVTIHDASKSQMVTASMSGLANTFSFAKSDGATPEVLNASQVKRVSPERQQTAASTSGLQNEAVFANSDRLVSSNPAPFTQGLSFGPNTPASKSQQKDKISFVKSVEVASPESSDLPTITNTDRSRRKKNIRWTDLQSLYSPHSSTEPKNNPMSRSQVSDRFNELLKQLEIVRIESLKHNVVNQFDMEKAMTILKNAQNHPHTRASELPKIDESAASSNPSDVLDSKGGGAFCNAPKEDVSTRIEMETSHGNSVITFSKPDAESEKSNSSVFVSKPGKSGTVHRKIAFENKTYFSGESSEAKSLTAQNQSGFDLTQNSAKSIDNKMVENTPRMINHANADEKEGSNSNDVTVTYDMFSNEVKASSCYSTPSKSPRSHQLQNEYVNKNETLEMKPTGFLILDEKTPPGKMAKKKEQFLLGRLKKEEEIRRKQMEKEMEAEKRKLEAKQQQEKLLQKKQEDKEKRNKIFKEHLKRKKKEEAAALRNPGVIGLNSPSHTKKSPLAKTNSYSTDRLHTIGHLGSNASSPASNLTTPLSARLGHFSGHRHPLGSEEDTDSLESGGSSEYTGPKLFKQLRSKSNRTLITNAINHCCLSGKVNEKFRNKTLKALEESEARHLMVLFRDNNCQFRALYSYHPDEERLCKICGNGPGKINPAMIEALFKYNSGRRAFTCVPSKTLSVSIDGITIKSSLWQNAVKK